MEEEVEAARHVPLDGRRLADLVVVGNEHGYTAHVRVEHPRTLRVLELLAEYILALLHLKRVPVLRVASARQRLRIVGGAVSR